MTRILAIDPGPTESAWLQLVDGAPAEFAKVLNAHVLVKIYSEQLQSDAVVIEQIEPRYGLNVGWETLDTARWTGRFEEAAGPAPVTRLRRSEILRHLGVATRGENRTSADAGVRAACRDRVAEARRPAQPVEEEALPWL